MPFYSLLGPLKFSYKKIINQFKVYLNNENLLLGVAAVLVGFFSGTGVWLFKKLIDIIGIFFERILPVWITPNAAWLKVLFPAIGGLAVGLLIFFFIGHERYHGVAGIMESVALAGGRLRYRRMPVKTLAAAISIGSGASVGPEDPSVQIGSNIGSFFGQWWRLSPEKVRTLVASGAAGGIAAAFNAPIAGVFFAIEIILGQLSGSALGIVVLSAVVSSVFTQAVSGTMPAFRVPPYGFDSYMEIPFYLGLGLAAGVVSALYIFSMEKIKTLAEKIRIPRWAKTTLAGGIVGLIGLGLPQIHGIGYTTIEEVLSGQDLVIGIFLLILLGKILATSISINGGFQGGVFAPALFIGAMLGGVYGQVLNYIIPSFVLAKQAFAMVGMAAVLAGTVRAPLTAILLLFEMTNDYRIILPLMLAVVVSILVAQSIRKESIYTLALASKGVYLKYGRDIEVLQAVTVDEVMQNNFPTLEIQDSVEKAEELIWTSHIHGLPVVTPNGQLFGILTLSDIEKRREENNPPLSVGEVCSKNIILAYPQEIIGTAMRKMGSRDVGQLPVVKGPGSTEVIGLITRGDLVKAYEAALAKVASARYRAQQVRISAGTEMEIDEIRVEPCSACDDQMIREIDLPNDCVIASILRGSNIIIPRGDTRIRQGDLLLIVTNPQSRSLVKHLCKKPACIEDVPNVSADP